MNSELLMRFAADVDRLALGQVHSVGEKWVLLRDIVLQLTDLVVPLRSRTQNGKRKPWMAKRVKEQLKLRDIAWKAYMNRV